VESASKLNACACLDKRQLSFRSCIDVLLRCIARAPPVNLLVTTELSNRTLSFVLLRPFTGKRSMISRDRREVRAYEILNLRARTSKRSKLQLLNFFPWTIPQITSNYGLWTTHQCDTVRFDAQSYYEWVTLISNRKTVCFSWSLDTQTMESLKLRRVVYAGIYKIRDMRDIFVQAFY